MLIAARNGFAVGKRLPYDAEVEYLESTGTQWIDTLCKSTATLEFRVKLDNSIANPQSSCGYFGTMGHWGNLFGTHASGVTVFWVRPNWRYRGTQVGMIEAYCGLDSITINGVVGQKESDSGNTFGGNIEIFRGRYGYTKIKMYSMQIYDKRASANGALVRDFIPVRFTNENGEIEGAMYDRANPTVGMNPDGSPRTDGLYRNRGAGAFVIGPDKSAANGGGGV